MIRPVYHPATGRRFDLAAATVSDIEFLRELDDNLPSREHGLICEAPGGGPVHVYKRDGACWVRHFPGGGHHGDHRVEPESDAHKRGKEYSYRAYDRAGITVGIEIKSNNETRSDVLGFGAVAVASEIQASPRKARDIKSRDTKARRATAIITPAFARKLPGGIQPVWTQIHDGTADWLHQVPSIRSSIRYGVWTERLPEPGGVGAAGVRTIDPAICRFDSPWDNCPHSGGRFCGGWHGHATVRTGLTVDDVLVQAASGLLVPIRYGEYIYLTDPASASLYAELGGDGTWIPGKPGSPRSLGPCRYKTHTEEDERERVAQEQAEQARAEFLRAELERVEREQLLRDRYWNMYRLARLRREQREHAERRSEPPQNVRAIRPQVTLTRPRGHCNRPGCGMPARLYPCGWRCDQHKP